MEFEAVIGLEIHIELNCATKLFAIAPIIPATNQMLTPARFACGSPERHRASAAPRWKKRRFCVWA